MGVSREVIDEVRLLCDIIYNCINFVLCTCIFIILPSLYFDICLTFSVKKGKSKKKWGIRTRGYFTLRWDVLKKPFAK